MDGRFGRNSIVLKAAYPTSVDTGGGNAPGSLRLVVLCANENHQELSPAIPLGLMATTLSSLTLGSATTTEE